MNIEEMLDRVVVIDNLKEEIDDLVAKLRSYDISVDVPEYTEDYSQLPVYTHNRQLIFMDLMLDEDESHLTTNISRVINILNHIVGQGFGPYGLVLWTKHQEKINAFLTRLDSAAKDENSTKENNENDEEIIPVEITLQNPPIFVIGIDKVQFKREGGWDFSDLMPQLNAELHKSNASYFFLRWLSVTRQASQETISNIYGLTRNYENKEKEITHILNKLALNQTGINHYYPGLTADAYKAFSDILHPKINALTGAETIPDLSSVETAFTEEEELPILAHLNRILFIDDIGIDQNEIVPGNIYEVKDTNCPVIVAESERIPFKRKNDKGKWEEFKNYSCVPIAVELTPPCDFSNKKVLSRIVGGYIVDFDAHEDKKKDISGGDKCYIIRPILIPGNEKIKFIIFDFRHLYSPAEEELKDANKYKVLFRANHPLFSDLLQKFSSHAARLGLKGLEPGK